MMDLSLLVQRAAEGDERAMAGLLDRFEARLRSRISQRIGSALRARVDTEDILQITLEAVWRDLAGLEYRSEAEFFGWMAAVAERRIQLTARHHGAARRNAALDTTLSHVRDQPEQERRAEGIGPEEARIDAMLAPLDELPRAIVRMRVLEGVSFAEIASRFDLPSEGAARQRYLAAVKRLAARR